MRFASRAMVLSTILVLAVTTVTFGQVEIPEGTATIDGDLSDWAGATWFDADGVYWSSEDPWVWPPDVPEGTAKWAARWSSETNMIYLAATIEDNDQIFTENYDGWNTRDAIEVYIDASNTDMTGYYWGATPNSEGGDEGGAQQWVFGPDGSTGPEGDGHWDALADRGIPEGAEIEAAVSVDGATINYEIAMTPWESLLWVYDDDGTTPLRVEDENSTVVQLAEGVEMGLDVVLGSMYGSNFGMMADNTDPGKSNDAAQLLNVTLGPADEPEYDLGDVNLDGEVNGLDVDPFVDLVTSGDFQTEADMNGDGAVNGLDVDPFVEAVVGGGVQAVPEPGTLVLALFASLALIALGRRRK
jgi:hypothetical protein